MITEFPKEGKCLWNKEIYDYLKKTRKVDQNGQFYKNSLSWNKTTVRWIVDINRVQKPLFTHEQLVPFITSAIAKRYVHILTDNPGYTHTTKDHYYEITEEYENSVYFKNNNGEQVGLTKGYGYFNIVDNKPEEVEIKPVSLVGRYLKALCNSPQAISRAKKDDLFLITSGKSVLNISYVKDGTNWGADAEEIGTVWELMPEGFTPPTDKDLLLEEANKRFPIGTKVKSTLGSFNEVFIREKELHISGDNQSISASGEPYVYYMGEWAEIVEDYQNILDIEVGDTVKCISEDKSKFSSYAGLGWQKDLEFVVTSINDQSTYKIYFGGKHGNGVYSDAVRLVKKQEKPIETYGLKVGDVLPEKVLNVWSKEHHNYISKSEQIWTQSSSHFYGDRTIEGFEIFHGVVGFKVSSTTEIYLKAQGFKQFMDNFDLLKFEIGKWYHFIFKYKGRLSESKFKPVSIDAYSGHIHCDGMILKDTPLNKSLVGINPNDKDREIISIREITDLTEIQQYLPEGHPDKVKIDVIPEYLECTNANGKTEYIVGKIYKTENGRVYNEDEYLPLAVISSNLLKYYGHYNFKPSTKEAYEKQNSKQSTVMEVGKWYQGKDDKSYGKLTGPILGTTFPSKQWISDKGRYYSDGSYFSGRNWTEEAREVPLSEIQKYLPDGHVDKISNEYVKCIYSNIPCAFKKGKIYQNHDYSGKTLQLKREDTNNLNCYPYDGGLWKFENSTKEEFDKQSSTAIKSQTTVKGFILKEWYPHPSFGDVQIKQFFDEFSAEVWNPSFGTQIVALSSLELPSPIVEVKSYTYSTETKTYTSQEKNKIQYPEETFIKLRVPTEKKEVSLPRFKMVLDI